MNLSAFLFIGAMIQAPGHGTRGFAGGRSLLAPLNAVFGFAIECLRFGGATALIRQRQNLYVGFVPAFGDGEYQPGGNVFTGLNAVPVALNFAALDGLLGEIACFKKTSGPEPFIDADFIHVVD